MEDKREKKWIWSTTKKRMVLIPAGERPTIGVYKAFKRPAYSVPTRKGEKKWTRNV